MDQNKVYEEALVKHLDIYTEKVKEEVKNIGQAHEETKNAINSLEGKLLEVQKEQAETAKQLIDMKLASESLPFNEKAVNFRSQLMDSLKENNVFESVAKYRSANMSVKSTMTTAANLLGDTIRPERLDGVIYPMPAMTRVRSVMNVLPLSASNAVDWIRETGYNNLADTVTDNANKPESDISLDTLSVPVQTIAHTMRLHKNMLTDLPLLSSYLATRGVDGLLDAEDAQLLYGDSTPPNLIGVLTDALSAFNPTSMYAALVAQGNRGAGFYDILRYAMLQVRKANLRPNAIMLSPVDKAAIDIQQIQDGAYRRQPDGTVLVNNIWGLPVVEVDALNEGEFAVGGFNSAATVFEREGISIGFFEQDRDNVQKNLVTVRIEERLAVATQRPEGIVTGEFADYLGKYAS
jgi:HK97 family phage major capsid protein